MDTKLFCLASVKAVAGSPEANGEFEAIISAPTLDRDGEIVDKGAFDPLPASLPIHAYHDHRDPVARAVPFYDGDLLKVRGVYASTARAQEIRALVAEGIVDRMSIGFLESERGNVDGVAHVTRGELVEASFVSIPANREASVLAAKSDTKPTETNPEKSAAALAAADSPADVTVANAYAAILRAQAHLSLTG